MGEMSLMECMQWATLRLHDCGYERTPLQVRKLLREFRPKLSLPDSVRAAATSDLFFAKFLGFVKDEIPF